MELLKRARAVTRGQFEKYLLTVNNLLLVDPVETVALQTAVQMLVNIRDQLNGQNEEMRALMFQQPEVPGADQNEADECAGYEERFQRAFIKVRTQLSVPEKEEKKEEAKPSGVKLPKITIEQFSGKYEDWISWRSQFARIDADPSLDDASKFWYLKQSMKDGTRAKEVVTKYAASVDNYPKAMKALQDRYGNPDKLIDVYIREFQNTILETVAKRSSKDKNQLTLEQLFDKLESSLNNLKTLIDIESSPFLFPMVLSCLPPHIVRGWERNEKLRPPEEKGDAQLPKLERLMGYLAIEVECEDSVARATRGLKISEPKEKEEKKGNSSKQQQQQSKSKGKQENPTVLGLANVSGTSCIFCGKHFDSLKCRSAAKMTKEEKEKKIKEANVCYKCLQSNHVAKHCKNEVKCTNENCNKEGHVAVMCYKGSGAKENMKAVPPPASSSQQPQPQQPPLFPAYAVQNPSQPPQTNLAVTNLNTTSNVLFPTLMVGIKGNDGNIYQIRAAIDTMSSLTYISRHVVLGLNIPPVQMRPGQKPVFKHAVYGGGFCMATHDKYHVELHALDWNYSCSVEVYDQEQIVSGIPGVASQGVLDELSAYGIQLMVDYPTQVDLLIGVDIAGRLKTGSEFQLASGLTAIQTKFGWTVMGRPFPAEEDGRMDIVEHTLVNLTYPNCMWELEAVGIRDDAEKLSKLEEDAATLEHFRRTVVRKEDGRYQVALPWIQGHPALPTNREIAEKRLLTTTKKLIQLERYVDYDEVFEQWLKDGIISEVNPDDDDADAHYLPHRAVIRSDHITTKVRPVFDASCRGVSYTKNGRVEHPSLNDCTVKGPNLLDHIPNLLLRFAEDEEAGQADIKSAFLMVEVKPEDRPKLRFLWWKDYHRRIYRVFQHNRVVFGVNCSPFLLNAVIEHHLERMEKTSRFRDTIKKLRKSLYVDNVVASFPNKKAYQKFRLESVAIMAYAKFDLRLWESNVDEEIGPHPTGVLGVKWDRARDQLFCEPLKIKEEKTITKKSILSAIAKTFDPLGMLSPVVLVPKILMQKCWEQKLKWEEEVPEDIRKDFTEWLEEMNLIDQARIQRRIGVPTEGSSLHVFADASNSGYAAVAYLRRVEAFGVKIKFIMCRSRVAPLKKTTINRLELVACEIATRLASTIQEALNWQHVPVTYWTDSTTAKAWIERNRDWGTFVGNRVNKIREKSSADQWQHVPGSMNPADLPSRGCGMRELINSNWLEGPAWLAKEPCYWPGGPLFYNEEEIDAELKKTALVMVNLPVEEPWYSPKLQKLGNFKDIVHIVAWMLRFKANCKKPKDKRVLGPLSFEEKRAAENHVFYLIQQEANLNPDKLPFRIKKEDGLIRVETKLTYREDEDDFKYPVLLPGGHYLTQLLIRQEHMRNHHAGVQFLLAYLRERVWILGGRKAVAKVLKSCLCCMRFSAVHPDPATAPLPENRIRDAAPFEVTGIDFAGPLFLKARKKAWIALFTCAVYRAIHLELVDGLTTEAFLLSLRRFIARRGRPSVIYTDNGTNFVGASNQLKQVDWNRITDEDISGRIKWIFNPPGSPWWGGFFERLVRSVKELLVRNLGLKVVEKDELSAILCDIEATINGRPLTYVFESDTFTPLTPALFLHGPRRHGYPDLDQLDNADRRYRYRQHLMENLRERFRKEYLGHLVQRRKEAKEIDLKVGDAVLIETDNVKRMLWPMGIITEFLVGRDGKYRACKLRTKRGEIVRPVQRLYPLELTQSYIASVPEKVQRTLTTRSGRTSRRVLN